MIIKSLSSTNALMKKGLSAPTAVTSWTTGAFDKCPDEKGIKLQRAGNGIFVTEILRQMP